MKRVKSVKRIMGILLTTALLASMLAGCGGDSGSAGSDGKDSGELLEVTMVSSSTVASMDFVWATVAEDMGYFEEEGLKVNVIECTDGSDPKMLASGQADFGGFSPSVGLSAVDSGVTNIQAVCNLICGNIFGFAYNKDSRISDWSDLEGKQIAVLSSTFSVIYDPILSAAGVDPATVEYVTYGSSEYEALDSNQAPAMGSWISEYYMCEGMDYDWGYLSGNDVLPQIANSIWVNTDFAKENPEAVKGFVRAICKAKYFCYLNPEATADLQLSKYPSIEVTWDGAVGSVRGNIKGMLGMTDEEIAACVENKQIGIFDMEIVDKTIQNLLDGGAISQKLDSAVYYTNEYVDTGWDYSEVEEDAANYEYSSKIYKEAQE